MGHLRRRPDEGFTLVELLVVVVIIGALAAIAIPSFLGQKSRAYQAAMSSDLKAVVTAQAALGADGLAPTTDLALLRSEGYRRTDGVSEPVIATSGATYVACVTHDGVSRWLTYDAATGDYSVEDEACA